jgi:hypothetical protein
MCIANTGMLSRLEAGLSESMILKGTTLRDCSLKTTGGNKDCLVLMDGNSIIRRCVLEAHGTGKSVKAASAQNVKITHSHIPQGLGTNVTNTETNPCNSGV